LYRPERIAAVCALFGLVACQQASLQDQPRYQPLEASDFYANGMASRTPLPGTIARGQLREDTHLYTGRVNGELATTFPFEITRADMERGQERFNIFCSPCHGRAGDGFGMIVQRGLKQPPSFHEPQLVDAPVGHFFDVITNGVGIMLDYSMQIKPEDRWRVAAYVRALQLSQGAQAAALPANVRAKLEEQTR
jgi:mono/diheme cytochrome c family protein